LFYEKVKKEELDNQRRSAIILAQSFMFATPAQDKNSARSKSNNWKRFLDSLDWDKMVNKRKPGNNVKGMKGRNFNIMLAGLGVPIQVMPAKEEKDVTISNG